MTIKEITDAIKACNRAADSREADLRLRHRGTLPDGVTDTDAVSLRRAAELIESMHVTPEER